MRINIFVIALCLQIVFGSHAMVQAQTNGKEIALVIQAELSKRGLTESEGKAALSGIGIDPDSATPEVLLERQADITKALDEAAAKKSGSNKVDQNASVIVGENTSTNSERVVEAAAENASKAAVQGNEPSGIYGHSIFTDQSLEVFRTTEGARAPDTYILGAGDRIRITIFGVSQADLQLEINSEGYVQPAGLPQIYLQGVNLADARRLLKQRFSPAYRFQSDQFVVSIQTARTVQVNVFGETRLRGTFTLSALNSPFGALLAAGGPNELGSVRAIELIRGKKRYKIDVYEFLADPSMANNLDLQNNDILYVPVARQVVSIEGAVKRPMKYELNANEGLRELVELAGGLNYNTFGEFVQIERTLSDSAALLEYRLSDVLNGKVKVPLADGDIIRIRETQKILESFGEVNGAVFYPGRYALVDDMTLSDLLSKAQLREEAVDSVLIVERLNRDGTSKMYKINAHEYPVFKLQFRDRVTVFSKEQFTNKATLRVTGAVRLPFETQLEYGDDLLLGNAILRAGGLLPTASEAAYIARMDLTDPQRLTYIPVNINTDFQFVLRAGDQLTIYDKRVYSLEKSLRVTGAVNSPVSFTFDPSLKFQDVIRMAGGFTLTTDVNRIDVFRLKFDKANGTGYERMVLEVDSQYNILKGAESFAFAPFDVVVVRDLPLFDLNRTVQLTGQLLYPGSYPLEASRVHLSQVIGQAGGLNVLADPDFGLIIRTTGKTKQIGFSPMKALAHMGDEKYDPILMPGDVIEIPILQNTVGIRLRATREADLLTAGVEVGNTEENDVRYFTYRGSRSAKWYIRNLAGGFAEKANKNSVTVFYPDGSVVGTRKYFGMIRDYPNLKPGAVISMTYKVPEPKKEKEKIDVDALYTRTLTSLTTLMTILILARQL